MHSVETILQILNSALFLGHWYPTPYLVIAQLSVSPENMRVISDTLITILDPPTRSVPSFSVQFSISYMKYSTFYYKKVFVFHDFSQLLDSVSALRTLKVG